MLNTLKNKMLSFVFYIKFFRQGQGLLFLLVLGLSFTEITGVELIMFSKLMLTVDMFRSSVMHS